MSLPYCFLPPEHIQFVPLMSIQHFLFFFLTQKRHMATHHDTESAAHYFSVDVFVARFS